MDENPILSLMELSHTATAIDVYDALEMVEVKRYMAIEEYNLQEAMQERK